MLRLKDLFKIDFSSKGGGKLADKIFNKYNITKEEREEVKNEIANGGGSGDTIVQYEYEYLKIDTYNIDSALLEAITSILNLYYYTIYKKFKDKNIDKEYVYAELTQLNAISDNIVYIKTIKNVYPNALSWNDRLEGEVFNVEKYKELLEMPNLDVGFNNFLKLNILNMPGIREEIYNKYCSIPTKEEMEEVIANTRYKCPIY